MFSQKRLFRINVEQIRQMIVPKAGFERDQAAVDAGTAQVWRVF